MIRVLGRAADAVLARVAPKATASADTSWNEWCGQCAWSDWFTNYARMYKICHVVGGISSCGNCSYVQVGC